MPRQNGISLIELMITVLLVCGLLLCGLPQLKTQRLKNQMIIRRNELITAVHTARNIAIQTGISMALIPDKDWSQGMKLYNDNYQHVFSSSDVLKHQWQWQHQGISITWKGFHSDSYLLFSAEAHEAAANGHFILKAENLPDLKLVVNRFGRVKTPSLGE